MEDGKVLIEVDLNDDGVNKALGRVENKAIDSSKKIGNSVSKLSDESLNMAKSAAIGILAIAGAFAGFSIKSAGDMQATNAQFAEVFSGMESDATKSVNNIAKETGMLPSRLKGTFTQMAAFAKTTGLETADALKLTERATMAAADSSAFYDKSIEETTETLQSYLKGNYENDAALGISSTETTRNAAANDLYGKSFIDLSEDQKQLTLLKMVEDGNKLAGAFGQAARETDGLENVMGNLRQGVVDVTAAFGAPILAGFISAAKGAVGVLSGFAKALTDNPALVYAISGALLTLAAAFGTVYLVANKMKILASIQSGFALLTNPVFLVVLAIGALVTAFVYLWQTNETFRTKVIEIWTAISAFLMPIIQTIVAFLYNTWNTVLVWWTTNQDSIKNTLINVWNAISAFLAPIIQVLVTFIMTTFGILSTWWNANQQGILNTVSVIWTAIQTIFSSVITLIVAVVSVGLNQIKTFWNTWGAAITAVVQANWVFISNVFGTTLRNILTVVKSVITQIKNVFVLAMNVIKGIVQVVLSVIKGDWGGALDGIRNIVSAFGSFIRDTFSNFMNTAKELVSNGIDGVKGYFDGLKNIDLTAAGKAIIDGFLSGLKSAYENVKNFVGGIADWIAENKGPISYDKKLLVGAGEAIMFGLNRGLEDNFSDVKQTVMSLTGMISKTFEKGISTNPLEYSGIAVGDVDFSDSSANKAIESIQAAREFASKVVNSIPTAEMSMGINNKMSTQYVVGSTSSADKSATSNDDYGTMITLLQQLVSKDGNVYFNDSFIGTIGPKVDTFLGTETTNSGRWGG
ncbi:phage tail protein [Carnobacterium pleistocenium]|uniref:phage tail protein n=1 Tax=Carnobacterium pleistocenium TaxID=181073 RepID=UPI00068BF306|nr:hypothetical protein [Carnobacterium pleistocenium]